MDFSPSEELPAYSVKRITNHGYYQPLRRIIMSRVGTIRLYVLRAMYLLIATGLAFTVWPSIIWRTDTIADSHTVIRSLLGALALLCVLGIRYPIQMLPILLFELVWKVIWVLAFALPMSLQGGLDEYASETLFACLIGVVLVPIAVPWGYVLDRYVRAPGDPWRSRTPSSSAQQSAAADVPNTRA
jgi:hypothetical protein